jgi:hypothetical protein
MRELMRINSYSGPWPVDGTTTKILLRIQNYFFVGVKKKLGGRTIGWAPPSDDSPHGKLSSPSNQNALRILKC